MRLLPLAALLLLALPVAAPAADEPAPTRVGLIETASRELPDDLFVAQLQGEHEAATAAEAQAALNRAMQQALARVTGVEGLRATTEGYHVHRRDPEGASTSWIARQTLRLESADRDVLLAEVGALQVQGLATRSLGSTLSEAAREAEHTALIEAAIEGLRKQASTVANALGQEFRGFAELQVDGARPMPMPR
ncbi:MAG: SIMPL domain-containing protein, partial [Pseudomonadota bacterium]